MGRLEEIKAAHRGCIVFQCNKCWLIAEVERLDISIGDFERRTRTAALEEAQRLADGTLDTRPFYPGIDEYRKGWNECRTAIVKALGTKACVP